MVEPSAELWCQLSSISRMTRRWSGPFVIVRRPAREWLIIESSMKHAVFADPQLRDRKGYIPRDSAEELLGRSLGGMQWFTSDESAAMRAHPEWREVEP